MCEGDGEIERGKGVREAHEKNVMDESHLSRSSLAPSFPDLFVEQPVPEPGGGAAGVGGGARLQDCECGADRTHFGGLQYGAGAGTGQGGGAGRLVRRSLQGECFGSVLRRNAFGFFKCLGGGEGCEVIV